MWEAENTVRGEKALQALIKGAEVCSKMVDVAATQKRCLLPNVCAQKPLAMQEVSLTTTHMS